MEYLYVSKLKFWRCAIQISAMAPVVLPVDYIAFVNFSKEIPENFLDDISGTLTRTPGVCENFLRVMQH
jgi:hypothetical protein